MMIKKTFLSMVLVLLLASLACSLGSLDVQGGGVSFDIRITESQLNAGQFEINIAELFSGSYTIDLQPGKMVISGTLVRPNGTETSGEAEVAIRANDGELQVEILAVDAEGIDLNDSRVQDLQRTIADNLRQAFQGQDFVSVESVEITDTEIVITVRGSLSGGSR
jgi:hypothetical protein